MMSAEANKLENLTETPETTTNEISDKLWWMGCIAVTAIASFLRFFWIEIKPLHHDEGVNGFFLTKLFRDGFYQYDAANYHGPTLYYFALAFTKVLGLETFAVRYSTAIFGVGIVILALCLRKYLGKIGALSAALFLALSPGMVFISRYFIHEILFVFFTFAVVVAVIYFMEKDTAGIWSNVLMAALLLTCLMPIPTLIPNAIADVAPDVFGDMQNTAGMALRTVFFFIEAAIVFVIMLMLSKWRDGKPIYLILASASCVLIFATKETAFISLGTMVIAFFCIWMFRNVFVDHNRLEETWKEPIELTPINFMQNLGVGADRVLLLSAVGFIFIYVGILFFSSFFTFPDGVRRAFEAYEIWTATGTKDHADKSHLMYVYWMGALEAPIFALGALGSLMAFWIAQHRFAMFAALWGFGLAAAYTIIPYKTPWLALSFILPVCLIAGYAINELAVNRKFQQKGIAAILVVVASGVLLYQTIELNFFSYDNEQRSYVYVQTKREFLDMLAKIDEFAAKSGKGKELSGAIVSKDYWPMPWYMNEYPNMVFHGEPVPARTNDVIITSIEQEKECEDDDFSTIPCSQIKSYKDNYEFIGTYPLRSGVDLNLYLRNDLAGKPLIRKTAAPDTVPTPEAFVEDTNK